MSIYVIKLETHGCIECGKPTTVPMVLPYNGEEDPTGMTIHYMDEDFGEHLIGVICKNCASTLCHEGAISIGYAGFPHSWDAYVSDRKPHKFPFLEKHRIQCQCYYCTEEDEQDDEWY